VCMAGATTPIGTISLVTITSAVVSVEPQDRLVNLVRTVCARLILIFLGYSIHLCSEVACEHVGLNRN
jgi:hypothetical protein